MRLLSARVRDYRRHRNLAVDFDPRFTVIAGPNQSGKSTLAEALHRALFLPVKTGGELLKAMQSNPFLAEPEVELAFEAGGERWTLRKRFAGTRGSVSLVDGRGHSLQGDEAEERIAALVGTSAVARTRGAAEQLRERWGHLWVWQGSASRNPLDLSSAAYDHDRLVERLQAGAEMGVTSALDLRVLEDIESRWATVFTAGGANREPQVRKGSPLQQARAAVEQARGELTAIEALIHGQMEAEQQHQLAVEQLARISGALPQGQERRQALARQLSRCRDLEAEINRQQPLLDGLVKDQTVLSEDRKQLHDQQRLVVELDTAQAPANARLVELNSQLPALETASQEASQQLERLEQASGQATRHAQAIEERQGRLKLLQEQAQLQRQLAVLALLQQRLSQLGSDLEALPDVNAAAVEQLRRLGAAVRTAEVRAESLAAGIEVLRAGQPLRLDGAPLEAGSSRLLSQPAVLQVGDDVELRLLPGGGSSAADAVAALEQARQALAAGLEPYRLASVEAVATAERRRSDLVAEQRNLQEQRRSGGDADKVNQRLNSIRQQLEALPVDPTDGDAAVAAAQDEDVLETLLGQLEEDLRQARQRRDLAIKAAKDQRQALLQCTTALDTQRQAIATAEQELRQQENQLVQARTRVGALLERHGSLEALEATLSELDQRIRDTQATLAALKQDLLALDPEGIRLEDQRLALHIESLLQEQQQATEARIRAEARLHGDGQLDLQAEQEQKQAELESRLQDQGRLEKEAAMLSLLRRLLDEEQNAMGSQYTAPITSRIGRYLTAVFPEAPQTSLSYDARGGFQELQWRHNDEAAFGFDVLSTGAREQFGAAWRIAIAEVLAEAYDGCLPVLFDDAFANSDPERQQGVHRMLMQAAGQGLQVILLTCDPERSQGIGEARQVLLGG